LTASPADASAGLGVGAIALYEESLQIKRAIGNQQGIAATLHAIANVYVNQGNVDGAIAPIHMLSFE